jgi:hypothetical protein
MNFHASKTFVISSRLPFPSFPLSFPMEDPGFPASFSFLNRKEAHYALQALNTFAESAGNHQTEEDFFLFLDAFQSFCLSR